MHVTLEAMASFARKTTGNVPPPLVGPTTTLITIPDTQNPLNSRTQIWVFGGREVESRRVSNTLWCLDVESLVWERIEPPVGWEGSTGGGGVVWPKGRYFHTADRSHRLRRHEPRPNPHLPLSPQSPPSATTTTSQQTESMEMPCVLNGLWVFDCLSRRWERPRGANTMEGEDGEEEVPAPRYAHLSVVSQGRLVITGGQDIDNEYILQSSVLDLNTWNWIKTFPITDLRGSYRSVSVSSRYTLTVPSRDLKDDQGTSLGQHPYSIPAEGGGGHIFTFSNSNFTDVRRQVETARFTCSESNTAEVALTDITTQMTSRSSALPPGLRFPFSTIIGQHLIIGGTYLSHLEQNYAVWALDLRSGRWRKVDAALLATGMATREGDSATGTGTGTGMGQEEGLEGGSWNKAVAWEEQNRLFVLGNKYKSLQEDYEHRAINFDHIATINLEIFGIYQPPIRSRPPPSDLLPFALRTLREAYNSDFGIISEDGRLIPCSRRILEERWPWFKQKHAIVSVTAKDIVDSVSTVGTPGGKLNGDHSPEKMNGKKRDEATLEKWKSEFNVRPGSLQISEPYPVCKALLEYFYTLELATPLQQRAPILSALLILAKQYKLDDLAEKVVYAMHERLTEQNALGVYEIATLCGCMNLQVRALRIVLNMQRRQNRTPTHRRDESGTGLTPSSSKQMSAYTSTPKSSGMGDGHSRQLSSSTPALSSGVMGPNNAYAVNLPPTSFHMDKRTSRSRINSLTVAQRSPVSPVSPASPASPSGALFTFPPVPSPDPGSDDPTPDSTASTRKGAPKRLRAIASHPVLSTLVETSPAGPSKYQGSIRHYERRPDSTSGLDDEEQSVELHYTSPPYSARPRMASLKSVHHYDNSRENRYSQSSNRSSASGHSGVTKENRPGSGTFGQKPKDKQIKKSKSIASFFQAPLSALVGRSQADGDPEVRRGSGADTVTVDIHGDEATLATNKTPVTISSPKLESSPSILEASPATQRFSTPSFKGASMALPHPGRSDTDITPKARSRHDRESGSGFTSGRPSLDSVDDVRSIQATAHNSLSLFYIPPNRS